MRRLILCGFITTMCLEVAGNPLPQTTFSHFSQAGESQDVSLLKPGNTAYSDAMAFARFLNDKGISVKSVHRSHLESFFRGIEKAAFFRTDKGVVEVIFFPDLKGAERVQVTEHRRAGRYIYSFRGQPNPNPPGDVIDANKRTYFIMHRNLFVVTLSKELYDLLKPALMKG